MAKGERFAQGEAREPGGDIAGVECTACPVGVDRDDAQARRIDAAYLARLVAEHRLREEEAYAVAADLAYNLPKLAYRL